MVFVRKRLMNGIARHYLEKSIRLLSGSVKKFSIYIPDYTSNTDVLAYEKKLEEKARKYQKTFAESYYSNNLVFNQKLLGTLEEMKLDYGLIIQKLTKKQLSDVLDRFSVNFTYESNAIEGNSLTLKDVTIIINENKVLKGKDLREVYETLNTRNALELIFKNKFKINEKDIIDLHKLLVKDTGVKEGYKQLPNFLLGRNVKTTPPENVAQEMKKLIDWHNHQKNMHPLEKASLFHGKFEKIHPFEDGNGRVGRMLVNIILLNCGYLPLIIRKSQRIAYLSALQAFDNGHTDKLRRFMIDKYKNTFDNFFKIYIKYL